MSGGRPYRRPRIGVRNSGKADFISQRLSSFLIPASGSTAHTESGASEAEPGFKEEERRWQNQQNNIVKYREMQCGRSFSEY